MTCGLEILTFNFSKWVLKYVKYTFKNNFSPLYIKDLSDFFAVEMWLCTHFYIGIDT